MAILTTQYDDNNSLIRLSITTSMTKFLHGYMFSIPCYLQMQISYNGCESGFVPVIGTCSKQIPTIDDSQPLVDIGGIVGAVIGILVLLVLVAAIYFKRLVLEI